MPPPLHQEGRQKLAPMGEGGEGLSRPCGEPRDGDAVDVLQGETSHGVEQPGEVARCGGEGVGGVQGGEEVFIEVAGVAGEVAFQKDGKALRVRIGAETVAQAAAGAGEDGGGELGGFFLRRRRRWGCCRSPGFRLPSERPSRPAGAAPDARDRRNRLPARCAARRARRARRGTRGRRCGGDGTDGCYHPARCA